MTRSARRFATSFLVGLLVLGMIGGWRKMQQDSLVLVQYAAGSESRPRPWWVEAHDYAVGLWWARRTARRIAPKTFADEQRIRQLAAWTFDHFIGWEGVCPVQDDHFLNVARRGYGYCDQLSHVLATLYWSAGYPARLRMLRNAAGESPHTMVEVRLDGRWIAVDPFFKRLFESADGRLLTVEELEHHPEVFAAYRAWAHQCAQARSGQERWLELADVQRGDIFTTVPYTSARELLHKIISRASRRADRGAAHAATVTAITTISATGGEPPSMAPSSLPRAMWRRFDEARWHELTGDDAGSRAIYRALVDDPQVDHSVKQPARFWLAAAVWRAHDAQECRSALEQLTSAGELEAPWSTAAQILQIRCAGEL